VRLGAVNAMGSRAFWQPAAPAAECDQTMPGLALLKSARNSLRIRPLPIPGTAY